MVLKDLDIEQPIPIAWRQSIEAIVSDLKNHNLGSKKVPGGRYVLDDGDVDRIYGNIYEYGDEIDDLHKDSWSTSICRWMGNYWLAIVDLFTKNEGASDLSIMIKVYEDGEEFRFDVQSVHVP